MMSKIQILKAIHNMSGIISGSSLAVYDVKDTNFESNSQHIRNLFCIFIAVYDVKDTNFESNSQLQFFAKRNNIRLFMMSKIQILKAIHNTQLLHLRNSWAVYDVKDTNFESNSQLPAVDCIPYCCCLWCQRYKFWKQFTTVDSEILQAISCLWCQRYKFWKQFTTDMSQNVGNDWLFMMSKIQILKAIHNTNLNDTMQLRLFMMSKIQILKAIHNKEAE